MWVAARRASDLDPGERLQRPPLAPECREVGVAAEEVGDRVEGDCPGEESWADARRAGASPVRPCFRRPRRRVADRRGATGVRREGSRACARGRRSALSSPTSGAAVAFPCPGTDHGEVALRRELAPQVRVRPRADAPSMRRDHERQRRRRASRAVLRGCDDDRPPGHAVVGPVADPPLLDSVAHCSAALRRELVCSATGLGRPGIASPRGWNPSVHGSA